MRCPGRLPQDLRLTRQLVLEHPQWRCCKLFFFFLLSVCEGVGCVGVCVLLFPSTCVSFLPNEMICSFPGVAVNCFFFLLSVCVLLFPSTCVSFLPNEMICSFPTYP